MIRITDKGRWWMLTPRQRLVFLGLALGLNPKELAVLMGLSSRNSVSFYVFHVYKKTKCDCPVDICRMAIRLRLIQP
jgi:DNA-binding NarL/FixJ family response regulator